MEFWGSISVFIYNSTKIILIKNKEEVVRNAQLRVILDKLDCNISVKKMISCVYKCLMRGKHALVLFNGKEISDCGVVILLSINWESYY